MTGFRVLGEKAQPCSTTPAGRRSSPWLWPDGAEANAQRRAPAMNMMDASSSRRSMLSGRCVTGSTTRSRCACARDAPRAAQFSPRAHGGGAAAYPSFGQPLYLSAHTEEGGKLAPQRHALPEVSHAAGLARPCAPNAQTHETSGPSALRARRGAPRWSARRGSCSRGTPPSAGATSAGCARKPTRPCSPPARHANFNQQVIGHTA